MNELRFTFSDLIAGYALTQNPRRAEGLRRFTHPKSRNVTVPSSWSGSTATDGTPATGERGAVVASAMETIVSRLERGDVELEESIAIYERGDALKAHCDHLLRQAEAKVAGRSAHHTHSSDDIVVHLAPAAVHLVVDGGEIMLHVDPLGHDEGSGHDRLQEFARGILAIVVGMQK